jgi:thioredoxin-related protein
MGSNAIFAQSKNEIHWITDFNELQAKMQQEPKKVYVDMYTDWCAWCKKMDASTFTNPSVINYMNTNYYCVKFNAERQDKIIFQGKEYHFDPQLKANTLAAEWVKDGSMMYPTAVIMLENFQNPVPLKGYLDVNQLETVVTYYGDNMYKHQNGADYQKTYKPNWDKSGHN